MKRDMLLKIGDYFKKRGIFFFYCFIALNVSACLPVEEIFCDITSHFRAQYVLFSLIFLIAFVFVSLKNKKFIVCAVLSLILFGINCIEIAPYFGAGRFETSDKTFKIGLFNVLTSNNNYNKLKEQIEKETPDILVLQEVNENWLHKLEELSYYYPYSVKYPREDNFGISLFSRFPLENSAVEYWGEITVPVLVSDVRTKAGKVKIYCMHTLPPTGESYFKTRNEMFKKAKMAAEQNSDIPVIIAGDFNSTVYSYSFKKYLRNSNLKDSQIEAKRYKGSWNAFWPFVLRVPLEHVMFSDCLKLNTFKIGKPFGSDHLPYYVRFGLN